MFTFTLSTFKINKRIKKHLPKPFKEGGDGGGGAGGWEVWIGKRGGGRIKVDSCLGFDGSVEFKRVSWSLNCENTWLSLKLL